MMLAPGYLSVLTEMGIPVWELRSQDAGSELTSTNVEFIESLPAVDCLIVIAEQDRHDEAIRLLHAMLFSIDITLDNSAIVSADQLEQLSTSHTQHKVLIAFGERLVPADLNSQTNGQEHAYSETDSKLKIIVSTSLTVLLSSPAKKALVWQDLQLLKAAYQAEDAVQSDLVIE